MDFIVGGIYTNKDLKVILDVYGHVKTTVSVGQREGQTVTIFSNVGHNENMIFVNVDVGNAQHKLIHFE